MANDQLDLIRTDRVSLPCQHCGQPTPNVWAHTRMDAFRLSYTEFRACSYRCAQSSASSEPVMPEPRRDKKPGLFPRLSA
jgi:hypothetical protein